MKTQCHSCISLVIPAGLFCHFRESGNPGLFCHFRESGNPGNILILDPHRSEDDGDTTFAGMTIKHRFKLTNQGEKSWQ